MTTPNTPANGGQILTDEQLHRAYQKGYDDFAGPRQFRHASNYADYHDAGLRAVRAALAAPAIPTVDRNAAIMRQALIDMQNPIIAMQREVPEGSVLNPHIAMQMASEPEWYKRHAQEALDKCATPATVKTAEDL